MAGDNVDIRPLTSEEKQDMIEMGVNTPEADFKKQYIAKIKRKYDIDRKPYCERCAVADFREKIRQRYGEYEITSESKAEEIRKKPIQIDLEAYGREKRFILEGDRPEDAIKPVGRKDKVSDEQVLGGYNIFYRCKERGCGHMLALSIDEYEQKVKEGKLPRVSQPWALPTGYAIGKSK
jgi:hypothetical protein